MQALQLFFEGMGFTPDAAQEIASAFHPKELPKGTLFSAEGVINTHIAFVEEGVFQYFYNQDGNEITTYVVGQNGFIASLLCVLKNLPAQENIRAITDSVIWQIASGDFNSLKNRIPGFIQFYTGLLEHQIVCIDESRFSLLTQTAEERYLQLLEKEPELLQQLPLQFLASTLGITPRHLSRIRKKIS